MVFINVRCNVHLENCLGSRNGHIGWEPDYFDLLSCLKRFCSKGHGRSKDIDCQLEVDTVSPATSSQHHKTSIIAMNPLNAALLPVSLNGMLSFSKHEIYNLFWSCIIPVFLNVSNLSAYSTEVLKARFHLVLEDSFFNASFSRSTCSINRSTTSKAVVWNKSDQFKAFQTVLSDWVRQYDLSEYFAFSWELWCDI